ELDFIELNMNLPQYNTENLLKIDFHLFDKEGIDFTIHLPEDMDLAAFEPYVRNTYVNLLKRVIMIMPDNFNKLNMHLHQGVYFTLPEQKVYLYKEYKKQFQENLYNSFQDILIPARERGIDICIENTGD
ncbi:MAG: sugar phosphate isomerase/epimerase, partial [bacterium]